jgi:hypothetical protein
VSTGKKVFAAFTGDAILRESGRLPFALLNPFLSAGYEVRVFDNLLRRLTEYYKCDELALPQPARLMLSLKDISFVDKRPAEADKFVYLFDHALEGSRRLPWQKRVNVRYDLFAPYRLRSPIIAPYVMHPAQAQWATEAQLHALRRTPRALGVLFAGDSTGYVRNRVRYPGPKLPRREVLDTLRERIPDSLRVVSNAVDIAQVYDAGFANKFVLSDSGTGIEPSQWLPTLARAAFFLCAPGMVMPMCHNVVEAMAVGTIPLINYPEWLHPRLEHLTNCIVFDGKEDLVAKMRLALSMPASKVAELRANAAAYYDSYMRPEVVVERIEARPERDVTLLLHTELNMAQNSARLNRNSVLMRGTESMGHLRWVGRAIDRYRHR